MRAAGANPNAKTSPDNGPGLGSKCAWEFATYSPEVMAAAGGPKNVISEQCKIFPGEIAIEGNQFTGGGLRSEKVRVLAQCFYVFDGEKKIQRQGYIKPAKEKDILFTPQTIFCWVGRKQELTVADALKVEPTPQALRDGKTITFSGQFVTTFLEIDSSGKKPPIVQRMMKKPPAMRFIGSDEGPGKPLKARRVIIMSCPEYIEELSLQEKWNIEDKKRNRKR